MANNPPPSEKEIFTKNYATFCNVLKHEDGLLPYLVEKNIISQDNLDEIQSKNTSEKGPTLLKHISGPLEINHTQGFYGLLEVMINHGKVDTQEFARKIRNECQSRESSFTIEREAMVNFTDCENIDECFSHFTAAMFKILSQAEFPLLRRACLENTNKLGGIPLPKDLKDNIIASQSLNNLFDVLCNSSYWNWMNIKMLVKMTKASDLDAASKLIQQYKDEVYSRKVMDVLQHIPKLKVSDKYYTRAKEKWNKSLDDVTVNDLVNHWSKVEQIFDVEEPTVLLDRLMVGCVEVNWLIPTELVERICQSIQTKISMLSECDILCFDIGGHSYTCSSTDKPITFAIAAGSSIQDGIEYIKRTESVDTPELPSKVSDKKKKKIPKENLKYTTDDLKEEVKDALPKFDNNILYEHRDQKIIEGVLLLLMVVNPNEFLATMNYFSKSEAQILNSGGNNYYVGKWGQIPAALVQGDQGTGGPGGAQQLTCSSINLFKNLKVIIALGVCGTMDRLGDVIVSSRIDGCNLQKIKDNRIINRSLVCRPGKNIRSFLTLSSDIWLYPCTKQGSEVYEAKAVFKPMLSGTPLIADGEYRDKLVDNVSQDAGGVEMEGIGVVDGIDICNKKEQIEFIIVKAGCDYADKEKNKEWQPVAAMAAADFVYKQLDRTIVHDWFFKDKPAEPLIEL